MADYWCRFFDPRGAVVSAEKLSAADDAEAVAEARRLFADYRTHDFDLRCGKRLVLRERLGAPVAEAEHCLTSSGAGKTDSWPRL